MAVLGIGGSNHDFAAAVIQNGRILVAIEDERITRVKHGTQKWSYTPSLPAVDYCLNSLNLHRNQLDGVFAPIDLERVWDCPYRQGIELLSHHLCHAASAFFTSPFEKSAILVVDGNGCAVRKDTESFDLETISIGNGDKNMIKLQIAQAGTKRITSSTWRYMCSNSIGVFYKIVTEALGFGERGQGRTMGLAAYGDESLLPAMKDFVDISSRGRFLFDPYNGFQDFLCNTLSEASNKFRVSANIARAAQSIFEIAMLSCVEYAHSETKLPVLCMAGGCCLNSAANHRLKRDSSFDDIFIYPAAGDNGLAAGAALYGYFSRLGSRRIPDEARNLGTLAYQGRNYSDDEVRAALDSMPVDYYPVEDPAETLSNMLCEGEVVAIFQGRSEAGPRALGNRSILASAQSTAIRDRINIQIKERESFRPLAPVVPIEVAEKFFEIDGPSPFMLSIASVHTAHRQHLAGVCHADGTARLQTVDAPSNPLLHQILTRYGERTGMPVLINTSFNGPKEPIVETPEDALRCFIQRPLDHLYLQGYLVERHTPWLSKPVRNASIVGYGRDSTAGMLSNRRGHLGHPDFLYD